MASQPNNSNIKHLLLYDVVQNEPEVTAKIQFHAWQSKGGDGTKKEVIYKWDKNLPTR